MTSSHLSYKSDANSSYVYFHNFLVSQCAQSSIFFLIYCITVKLDYYLLKEKKKMIRDYLFNLFVLFRMQPLNLLNENVKSNEK